MTAHRSRHRALALTLIGVILVLHAVIVQHGEAVPDRDTTILHTLIPIEVRIGAWFTTGILAASLAWTRWQWIAAAAAVLMPFERAISHTWAWLTYIVPGVSGGHEDSWARALQWGAWTALIMLITRWTEVPSEVQHRE